MPGRISALPPAIQAGFTDGNNRIINYLRLSVTDRCNMRCIYCMPAQGVQFIDHDDILTYEEMLRLVRLCICRGIRKVRLTGGEPLVRKNILPFIETICRIEGLDAVSLTTNGVLLKDFARDLFDCGIRRVNISLDTLRPDKFRHITRRDYFDQVWEGIEAAAAAGLRPIKINIVAMKHINDDEILDFARLTLEKPYHVRFIEIMPVGEKTAWNAEKFLSTHEILGTIQQLGPLISLPSGPLDGPAERYALKDAKGEIGLIGALSNHFCDRCNRLRLTADGHLRGCLFSEQEADLKTPLRQGQSDGHLLGLITRAILDKPARHGLHPQNPRNSIRQMNGIGG